MGRDIVFVRLDDDAWKAVDEALRIAGVKYHGGKRFNEATAIREIRKSIKGQVQHVPKPGDRVIDLDEPSNYSVIDKVRVHKLQENAPNGELIAEPGDVRADVYYPELDIKVRGVKHSALLDARDIVEGNFQ